MQSTRWSLTLSIFIFDIGLKSPWLFIETHNGYYTYQCLQVCVDVFITTQTYVDVASISVIPRTTGGQVFVVVLHSFWISTMEFIWRMRKDKKNPCETGEVKTLITSYQPYMCPSSWNFETWTWLTVLNYLCWICHKMGPYRIDK